MGIPTVVKGWFQISVQKSNLIFDKCFFRAELEIVVLWKQKLNTNIDNNTA